jgi:aspartyl-tRNA synthetase
MRVIKKRAYWKEVIVNGWVHRRRDFGNLIFIDLRDVSGLVQIVLNPENNKEVYDKALNLRSEDVIGIKGKVVARQSPNAELPTGEI